MKERIALIMAHPDDVDIWAGGTLFNNYSVGGTALIYYLFCDKKIRKREAEKAAKKVNAGLIFGDKTTSTDSLVRIISDFNPTIIITHWENDCHFEHKLVFGKVIETIPLLIIENRLNFNLFSCDCYNSIGHSMINLFCPTDYVDISSVWSEKIDLIKTHDSQPSRYWIKMVERQNKIHGARVGVEFAEAFIQIPVLGVVKRSCKYLRGVESGYII
ncbi:hypothetical protein D4R87_00315 [bacterium]|nr:MAG: hypothetical protein D4R87_00315 [bacterium]